MKDKLIELVSTSEEIGESIASADRNPKRFEKLVRRQQQLIEELAAQLTPAPLASTVPHP
jgi:hypothetical protein